MKTTTFRSRVWIGLLAGALVAPAPLFAQADSVRTHVVQRGETLWSLAATYLGDGHRWREIVSANPNVIRSEQQLPVGATIRIPARNATSRRSAGPANTPPPTRPSATDSARATPPAPERPVPPASRDSVPPAATPPTPATVRDSTPPSPSQAPTAQMRSAMQERTIFYGMSPAGGFAPPMGDSSGALRADTVALPASLFTSLSIPYVIEAANLRSAGRCLNLESRGESMAGAAPGGALLRSILTLTPPLGVARPGDRFVLVRPASDLPGLGRVAIPTAVVRVTEAGSPMRAEVIAQFDVVECSDAVVRPMVSEIPMSAEPTPIAAGASGRVVWVGGDAMLPAIAHSLIVDIGAMAGVQAGDRITVFAEDNATEIASAVVVRVDGLTASAMITRRPGASVITGLPARLTGKLP